MVVLISPEKAKLKFADNVKQHRLSYNFTQQELSERSGIPLGTIRRFEQTGEISMSALVQILAILRLLEPFVTALEYKVQPKSVDEFLALHTKPKRQRARHKSK